MKKTLISLLACAATLAASAEVTLFVAQGAPMCRYHGTPDQVIEMYSGFNFRFPSETKQRVPNWDTEARFYEKALAGDFAELWGRHLDGVNDVSCDHISDGSLRWYWNRSMCITAAAGTSVTDIKMKLQRPETTMPIIAIVEAVKGENGTELRTVKEFSWNPNDSTLSVSGSYTGQVFVMNMGENYERKKGVIRPIYIEVTTAGTSSQVAVPEFKTKRPMLGENEMVELSCSTPGAQIYYTIDNDGKWNGTAVNGGVRKNDPTTASTLYTGPFALEKDAIVRAIAVKEGMTNSFINFKEYYVMPEFQYEAVFDFTDHTSIKDENGEQIAKFETYPVVNTAVTSGTTEKVSIVMTPAVEKDVTISGTIANDKGEGCDITLSNSFGGVVELRPLKNTTVYISVPDDKYLSAVMMEASTANAIVLGSGVPGTYKNGFVTTSQKIWTYDGRDVFEVALDVTDSSQYVDRFFVFYSDINSGVDDVTVDANAPVEYFNLQGMRVDNPAKGRVYIKRQGAKASKVII